MPKPLIQMTESHFNWLKLVLVSLLLFSTGVIHGRIIQISKRLDKVSELSEKVILIEEISNWNEKQIVDWQDKVNNYFYDKKLGGK